MNDIDDEPTRMGAPYATDDDPTRLRAPEPHGASDWYEWSPLSAVRGGPASTSGRRPWVVPAALVAVAALGFGGVSAIMAARSHSSTPHAATGTVAAATSPQPLASVASPVPYPSGAKQDCLGLDKKNSTLHDASVAQAGQSAASCDFLVKTKDSVWSRDAGTASTSPYSIDVLSQFLVLHPRAGHSKYVTLHCASANGLTTCTGGDPEVTIYVRPKP